MSIEPLVICDNLVKIYKVADLEVVALQGLDLEVQRGEMMALVGASGSGKSTLMNITGALDTPSAGRVVVGNNDLSRMNEIQRTGFRRHSVGHIWQQSGRNLMMDLSLQENVELPQMLSGIGITQRSQRAKELLNLVGLGSMIKKKPLQLSGGEQQRVAIAVALANSPDVLLADEPTGELDSMTAQEIFALLRRLNKDLYLTIMIVTHDPTIAALADRTIAIRDGRTSTETIRREEPINKTANGQQARSAVIGLSLETHMESVVIDRVGRMQLPKEAIDKIPFNGRADVRIFADHVEVWPVRQHEQTTVTTKLSSNVTRKKEQ